MFSIFYFHDCRTHKKKGLLLLEKASFLSDSMSSVLTPSFSPEEKDNYIFILVVYYTLLTLS